MRISLKKELTNLWMQEMSKETRRLSQGYKNTKGTKTMNFMTHN